VIVLLFKVLKLEYTPTVGDQKVSGLAATTNHEKSGTIVSGTPSNVAIAITHQ
jgi:hypothetical protein